MNSSLHGSPQFDPEEQNPVFRNVRGRSGSADFGSSSRGLPPPPFTFHERQSQGGGGSSGQYSPYSQASAHTPPAAPPGASASISGQPQSFFTTPSNTPGPISTMSHKEFDVPMMGSKVEIERSTYELMTLDTEQGRIQVPDDVQAVSKKVTEKKCYNNARDFHHYGQRRQEMERETLQNITNLEQQIREMEEGKERCKREKNHFIDIVASFPGNIHHHLRPFSPSRKRHASLSRQIDLPATEVEASEVKNSRTTVFERAHQRRKEYEILQQVAKLEQQLREVKEEKWHYKRESSYFRNLAIHQHDYVSVCDFTNGSPPSKADKLTAPLQPKLLEGLDAGGPADCNITKGCFECDICGETIRVHRRLEWQ